MNQFALPATPPTDPVPLPPWADDIPRTLLPALQQAGLVADLRATLRVQTWLVEAARRGALGADPADCRATLAALLARSAREQALFEQVFGRWLAERELSAAADAPASTKRTDERGADAGAMAGDGETREPRWRRIGRKVWRIVWRGLAGLMLLLLVLAGGLWLYDWWQNRPVEAEPAISLTGVRQDKTDLQLDRSGPRRGPLVSAAGASAGGSEGASAVGGAASGSTRAPDAGPSAWQRSIDGLANPERGGLFGIHPGYYLLAGLLLASLSLTLRRAQRTELARISTREQLREQQVYAGQRLRRVGQRRADAREAARLLRRPQQVPIRRLDLPATVQASVRAAGCFTPVWQTQRRMRGVLVLIDRNRPGEPFGQLAHRLVDALASEGVAAQIMEFDRDPRWVAPWARLRRGEHAPPARRLPLASLEALHGGAALLICSDGQGLLDTRHGTPHPWVERALAAWPDRALLTPLTLESWGAAEDRLTEPPCNLLVAPAQLLALPAVAAWLQGAAELPALAVVPGAPARLPTLLRGSALRWLGSSRPGLDDVSALLGQLRAYLGSNAYTWLAASAAYPQISAELTEYLADLLDPPGAAHPDAARLREARLLALAWLPWFRQGQMPDWLRLALLGDLAPQTRQRVRAALERLLARPDRQGEFDLGRIATQPAATSNPPLWQRARGALQRHWRLQALAADEPEDSPLRDVIYLGVLDDRIDELLRLQASPALGQAGPATGARLTRNPLRWLAAGWVLLAWPARWLWWQVWPRATRNAGNLGNPR